MLLHHQGGRPMKGEGGPAGGAAASTVQVATKVTKRVDAARVGVPGLRKTVATLDAALSPTEIDELLQEAGQPCHGGYARVEYAVDSGVEDVRDVCCAAGTRAVSMNVEPAMAGWLFDRVKAAVPDSVRGLTAVGISPRATLMRLETGQRCGPPHVDRSVLLHPAATPTGWVGQGLGDGPRGMPPRRQQGPMGLCATTCMQAAPSAYKARRSGSCFAEDECLEVDGGDDLASFGLRSTLTVMVLLRVVGPAAASGSLRVYSAVRDGAAPSASTPFVDVPLAVGRAVIFDHRVHHCLLPAMARRHILRFEVLYSAQERWRERVAGSEAPEVPHVTACVGPSGELQAPGATLPRHGEAVAAGATGVAGLSAAPMTLTSAHGITAPFPGMVSRRASIDMGSFAKAARDAGAASAAMTAAAGTGGAGAGAGAAPVHGKVAGAWGAGRVAGKGPLPRSTTPLFGPTRVERATSAPGVMDPAANAVQQPTLSRLGMPLPPARPVTYGLLKRLRSDSVASTPAAPSLLSGSAPPSMWLGPGCGSPASAVSGGCSDPPTMELTGAVTGPLTSSLTGPVRFSTGAADLLACMQAGLRMPASRPATHARGGGAAGAGAASTDASGSSVAGPTASSRVQGGGGSSAPSSNASTLTTDEFGTAAERLRCVVEAGDGEDGADSTGARKRRSVITTRGE